MEFDRTNIGEQKNIEPFSGSGKYGLFFKLFLWQLLRMAMVYSGMGCGLYLGSYASESTALSEQLAWILFYSPAAAGFLAGVAASYLIEYRRRLSVSSFLSEVLLTFIAIIIIGICIILGFQGSLKVAETAVSPDGTGIFVLLFLFSGGLTGFILGNIPALLLTTLWKFWRGGGSGSR